jgi:hypothetical protein
MTDVCDAVHTTPDATPEETRPSEVRSARCWICSNPADSGEHKAKKSDLRAVFGPISQGAPLLLNDAANKNRRVGSLNADAIKWKRMLCHTCNTARTQRHDQAWEALSNGLRSWTPSLRPGSVVRADRIFPNATAEAMLLVHLYFAKALGCLVVEADDSSSKIEVQRFAQAILDNRAHPDLYLALGIPQMVYRGPIVSASDPMILKDPRDDSAALATWFYNVDGICMLVAYAPNMAVWARSQGLWHPRDGSNRMVVRDFSAPPGQGIGPATRVELRREPAIKSRS